jgi:DNA-binding response OmpR family regulator
VGDPAASHACVAVLCAGNCESNVIRGVQLGAADFILKPFSQKDLKERVENVFRPNRAHEPSVGTILCVDDQQVVRKIVQYVRAAVARARV